jgi:hypothetical protein
VAKRNISIYTVKANFSKIVSFKGAIRNILNMVAAHIEGLKYPPYAFCVNAHLNALCEVKKAEEL